MRNFKAGNYISQGHYKSFQPSFINKTWKIDDMSILTLLSKADRHLGRLDMYSKYVNIDLFISMHIIKEATQSSKIENTQTSIEEALMEKENISIERKNDWEEVQNYIAAMNEAVKMLGDLPFSSRLIKKTHKILLRGVRGTHKLPGEYRTSQNWIGGVSISDAVFIPPVHTSIHELMSDLEKFANDELALLPDLLKIALIHYQFETVHPFLDGNGRIGRLLITLYLVDKGILKNPILYLSDFFERNRILYYDNLMRVRTHDNLVQWCKFFLVGIIETAQNGIQTFDSILELQKSLHEKFKTLSSTKSGDAYKVVEYLYKSPLVNTATVSTIIGKTQVSAYRLIASLEKLEVLTERAGSQKGKMYVFKDYVDLFKTT